jgi:hypothetical protein
MSESSWLTRALAFKNTASGAEVAEEEPVLILIEGRNSFGDKIFCYLKLPYSNYRALREKMFNKEKFNPRDHGEIVAAGLGQPTEEIKNEIKEEYGFVPVSANEPPSGFEYVDDDDLPF